MRNRFGIWTWRAWAAVITLSLGGVVLQACSPQQPQQPSQITIVNNNSNQNNNGSGTPSSPAPGVGAVIASVSINGFGEACPVGVAPSNETKTVRVGCTLAVTVNPRDASGKVIFDTAVTGLAPDYFLARGESPAASFTQDGGNPFNGQISGKAAGTIVLAAAVKGVPSGDTTFTVVK